MNSEHLKKCTQDLGDKPQTILSKSQMIDMRGMKNFKSDEAKNYDEEIELSRAKEDREEGIKVPNSVERQNN